MIYLSIQIKRIKKIKKNNYSKLLKNSHRFIILILKIRQKISNKYLMICNKIKYASY